jgi:hypothetical protein
MKISACRAGFLLATLTFSAASQAQFAGKWQSKISPVTGKHSITVNIVVNEGKFSGTVILVSPDASEIESEVSNAKLRGENLEFETKFGNGVFDWRLTLQKGNGEGLLHGSIGEMVIDERVVRQH